MFNLNLFGHRHVRSVVNTDGTELIGVPVACKDVDAASCTHTSVTTADDGKTRMFEVFSCQTAEAHRNQLLQQTATQATAIGHMTEDIAELKRQLAEKNRLIANAMQIVFRLGHALKSLVGEELMDPCLSDDGKVVKIQHPLFTILIDPFEEILTVHPLSTVVEDCVVSIKDGQLDRRSQMVVLGMVERIRMADRANGADPVQERINLINEPA